MSGSKTVVLKGDEKKLHFEELRDFSSSLSIMRVIKSRGMRWEERMSLRKRREMYTFLLCRHQKGVNHQEIPAVDR